MASRLPPNLELLGLPRGRVLHLDRAKSGIEVFFTIGPLAILRPHYGAHPGKPSCPNRPCFACSSRVCAARELRGERCSYASFADEYPQLCALPDQGWM